MSEKVPEAKMYTARREKLLDQMGEGIAMIGAGGVAPDPTLFDKNLFYLTGQRSKQAILLMAPDGVRVEVWETIRGPELGRGRLVRDVLFVEELSERQKAIDGQGSSVDAIRDESGVELVLPLSQLNGILHDNLICAQVLWVNIPTCPRLDKPLSPDLVKLNEIRQRFLWLDFKNMAPLIHRMRWVKEPYEVECLRKAFEIHTAVYEEIMRALKPGKNEALGEAIWHYKTRANYDPQAVTCEALDLNATHLIVAAGANTTIGHYMDNNQVIQDGDLVLIDAGLDYQGYSSDITRTFPASGKFTPRQRELYEIVLQAQRRAIDTMKPGSTSRDAHRAVYEHFKKHGLDRYGYGRCGHPVGLNIHDANGMASWDQDHPFEPGVVIAIEPFLVIPEEGIGIRTEDGVLITEDGHEMMPGPAKEIAEVEALCSQE